MTIGPHKSSDLDSHAELARDRRRPGRPVQVNRELVPILRGTVDPLLRAEIELSAQTFGNPDQTRAMTGIAVGLCVSAAFWTGAIAAVRHFIF